LKRFNTLRLERDATLAAFEARLESGPHLDLFHYWRGKVEDGRLPSRALIDPVEIPALLRFLVLAEVSLIHEAVTYRLVGTENLRFWGKDFTGKRIEEQMQGDYLAYIKGLYLDCARFQAPVLGNSVFRWDAGRTLGTRRLFLPLSTDARKVDMVLVCQVFDVGRKTPPDPMETIGPPVQFEELDRRVAV